MTDDYLWDGSGTPDPEIQRLESLLAEFRHRRSPTRSSRRIVLPRHSNLAACFSKCPGFLASPPLPSFSSLSCVGLFFSRRPRTPPDTGPSWNVASLEGAPQIGSQFAFRHSIRRQTLCRPNSHHQFLFARFPFRKRSRRNSNRSQFSRSPPANRSETTNAFNSMSAPFTPPSGLLPANSLWTRPPPSPSISVAPTRSKSRPTAPAPFAPRSAGSASISTAATRSSPQAPCASRAPRSAPALPISKTPANPFAKLSTVFDLTEQSTDARSKQLNTVLSQARPRDGLTLWHLLSRTTGPERAQVYARFADSRSSSSRRHSRRHPRSRSPHARSLLECSRPRRHLHLALLGTVLRTQSLSAPTNAPEKSA